MEVGPKIKSVNWEKASLKSLSSKFLNYKCTLKFGGQEQSTYGSLRNQIDKTFTNDNRYGCFKGELKSNGPMENTCFVAYIVIFCSSVLLGKQNIYILFLYFNIDVVLCVFMMLFEMAGQ